MTRMTGPDCAVMRNLINKQTHTHTHTHTHKCTPIIRRRTCHDAYFQIMKDNRDRRASLPELVERLVKQLVTDTSQMNIYWLLTSVGVLGGKSTIINQSRAFEAITTRPRARGYTQGLQVSFTNVDHRCLLIKLG